MSGLSNTTPHYIFRHFLTPEGFDQWAKFGLGNDDEFEINRMLPVDVAKLHGTQTSEDNVIQLNWVKLKIIVTPQLAFEGRFVEVVGGQSLTMEVTGYIARSGRGVMWVKDGVTPL